VWLERDGSLLATSTQKGERPVGERRQAILEAGQECQMDDEPENPRPEPAIREVVSGQSNVHACEAASNNHNSVRLLSRHRSTFSLRP
jgi:hypothetical protein